MSHATEEFVAQLTPQEVHEALNALQGRRRAEMLHEAGLYTSLVVSTLRVAQEPALVQAAESLLKEIRLADARKLVRDQMQRSYDHDPH